MLYLQKKKKKKEEEKEKKATVFTKDINSLSF